MGFVVKDRVWPGLRYKPHPGQALVHQSLARHRVLSAGRRFGKSETGGKELVPEAIQTFSLMQALEQEGISRRFWIVGPDYSDAEKEFRVIYNDLKRMEFPFDKPGTYNNPYSGDMQISLWGGKFQVHTKSAKYPDSLDGEGLFGVLLVEAAKLKEVIFDKYIRPALADSIGWSMMTSTPEGKNWFYKRWQSGQDPSRESWDSWRMPSYVNNIVFPGGSKDPEILDMKADMSEERFKQEILADFTEYVGRVFKEFEEEIHVTDIEYRPDLPLVIATDYGWTNPFVCLAIQWDVFDRVFVLGEYREVKKDIREIARDLQGWPLARNASELFPDPAEPGDTHILEKALHVRSMGDTGGPLKWRLEQIRHWLKMSPEEQPSVEKRHPKLLIDRKCVGLIREMQDYRYPDSKKDSVRADPELPMDKDDHGPEALGRFFKGHFGGPEEDGNTRAVVRKAVFR